MPTTWEYDGYCACGCGERTKIADRNHGPLGWKKGEPFEYITQHQNNKKRKSYVEDKNGCHIWQGQPSQRYPSIKIQGKQRSVHKWAWEQAHGKVPTGMVLHHTCSNTRCVNVEHLEVVTQAENTHHGRGTRLTMAKAERIRRLAAVGHTYNDLAWMYGVSRGAIEAVVYGHTWKSVERHRPHPSPQND